jgi:aminopeptidase N
LLQVSLLSACGNTPPATPATTVNPVTPITSGISLELAQQRKATLSDVRYRFSLAIPAERAQAVTGTAEVIFHWQDADARGLVLDFRDPRRRVHRVEVNGVASAVRFEEDHVIVPAGALKVDALNRVVLEITAGDEALNRNDGFLYTLFVPDRAHFSLPVFDQPDLKGRVTWELTIPGAWSALANGPRSRRSPEPAPDTPGVSGRVRVLFAESEPLPTYLFAFAAGEFETIRQKRKGRVLEMLHRETDREKLERNVEAIFDLHVTALDWLETYTGIEYPFQSFGFVLIPSFQYGGMEHPGAITYRASSLLLEENATEAQMLSRASLIAHETAHMWFGDLVTMAWFDDVWTKEVFANFMAAKIVHPSFPDVDHDLRFLLAHHPRAYSVDRSRGANAIRQPLENLDQAGTLYGAIIYQKAPVVMKQLERLLGEERFRQGMREYLSRYQYANATWPDLVNILDELHPSDLRAWSEVWVEQPGRPTVTVERGAAESGSAGSIVVRQSDSTSRGRVWPQRLDVGFFSADTTGPIHLIGTTAIDLQDSDIEVALPAPDPVSSPIYVVPNTGGAEYGLFEPDPLTLEFLTASITRMEAPLLRGVAWLTLWDAMLEGRLDPDVLLNTGLDMIRTESEEQLVSQVLADVSEAFWRFLDIDDMNRWAPRLENAIWSALEASEARTRRAAFFAAYIMTATTPKAVQRLGRVWSAAEDVPGLTLSQEDRMNLAMRLALHETDGWREILATQASEIDNPDRLAEFRYLLDSLDADLEVRAAFFESLRDPANRSREPWVLDGLTNLHHPLRARTAVQFVLPALEMLEEIQRTGDIFFPTGWMASTLSGHNSTEVVDIVEGFLAARPDYPQRLVQKILQASDMVERSARIAHGDGR